MGRTQPRRPAGLVKIGDLARAAGVPPSTIKHYVRVGLLPPPAARPNRQMAYYDEGLVDRIQAIKRLQTERFLPLDVIARILGPPPRPGECRGEALRAETLVALAPVLAVSATRPRHRAEILAELPHLAERDLDALARAGLVSRTGPYDDTEAAILQVVHDARAAGLGEIFPLEILGPYVEAVRRLVRLEIDLFRHRMAAVGRSRDPSLEDLATAAATLGERLIVALRRRLVPEEVRRTVESAPTRRARSTRRRRT